MRSLANSETASPRRLDGPRERLEELGSRALADAELVALVLGHGVRGCSSLEAGQRLLGHAGGLRQLARCHPVEWSRQPGLGRAQAARLAAVFEIARRIAGRAPPRGAGIRRPRELADHLMARYRDEVQECFGVLLLDGRNRFVRQQELSRGGWSASVVRPRAVFRHALLTASPAIVLFHNHPSGDPTPSREDIAITVQLCDAGRLLGIRVLDHLVVAAEGFVSMRERGLL